MTGFRRRFHAAMFPIFIVAIFLSPVFAITTHADDELPVIWLEAGKTVEWQGPHAGPERDWSLRYEHRVLDSGKIPGKTPGGQVAGHRVLKIRTPSLKPGIRLRAGLFFGDRKAAKVIIASADPFVDREAWAEKYPFVLYEPPGLSRFERSSDALKNAGFSHETLGSYAEIEAHERGVLVITENVDFMKERGLMELLHKKAVSGLPVLVIGPEGDVPLNFGHTVASLVFHSDRKTVLPDCPRFDCGDAWTLRAKDDGIVLSPEMFFSLSAENVKIEAIGPKILDIRFSHQEVGTPRRPGRAIGKGRLYFDKDPFVRLMRTHVEARYYFKSLIETLSDQGEPE